jgi:hypothetical protein
MSLGTAHPHISGLNGLGGLDGLDGLDGLNGLDGLALCLHHAHAMFDLLRKRERLSAIRKPILIKKVFFSPKENY